ncbi:MAG TPA: hypothetical protein QF694_02365 [Dehalococcoidia bacterium]|jgi:hypothetical protein|nr:hypothetical protein [Chloroflexota bacterium]MDP7090118.1 hypothetical protein [Dehalococcoidia bacterium]HJP27635.1 hypothetical protein [Dehalococcoidia bacterium]|tara:strand:+ start:649 stop:861 length:213 start_codon:yes stop_codon:yes gene_type:complete
MHPASVTVGDYYSHQNEAERLTNWYGLLKLYRTRELLTRFLLEPPVKVLDVGGAAGIHSFFWLIVGIKSI